MEGGKGEQIMHFHNAKVASQFIQRVLEKKFKRIVQIQHNPTEKRLHMNLIEKLPCYDRRNLHYDTKRRYRL